MVRVSHITSRHICWDSSCPGGLCAQVWLLIQRLCCETAQEPPLCLKPTTETAKSPKSKKTRPNKFVNANAGGLGCPTAFLLSSLHSGGALHPLQLLIQPCPARRCLARYGAVQIEPR